MDVYWPSLVYPINHTACQMKHRRHNSEMVVITSKGIETKNYNGEPLSAFWLRFDLLLDTFLRYLFGTFIWKCKHFLVGNITDCFLSCLILAALWKPSTVEVSRHATLADWEYWDFLRGINTAAVMPGARQQWLIQAMAVTLLAKEISRYILVKDHCFGIYYNT